MKGYFSWMLLGFLGCCYANSSNLQIHFSRVTKAEPDVSNKTLVLSLAELAANAYHYPSERNTSNWRNSTKLWEYTESYGWDVDGLRGHVFKHVSEKVIVFSVKGTTLNSKKDKESANLICSCNCCFANCTRECDKDRLLDSLPNMYLTLLMNAYEEIQKIYPDHSYWFTGHSMGSVISSLAAMKTCNPAVGFSAPGEQLFADRIGLKHTCDDKHRLTIHHIGYEKDPIFAGTCGTLCWLAGYNMESKCHHGTVCAYTDSPDLRSESDTFDRMWNEFDGEYEHQGSTWIYRHTINYLIDKLIAPRENVPECKVVTDCVEKCNV